MTENTLTTLLNSILLLIKSLAKQLIPTLKLIDKSNDAPPEVQITIYSKNWPIPTTELDLNGSPASYPIYCKPDESLATIRSMTLGYSSWIDLFFPNTYTMHCLTLHLASPTNKPKSHMSVPQIPITKSSNCNVDRLLILSTEYSVLPHSGFNHHQLTYQQSTPQNITLDTPYMTVGMNYTILEDLSKKTKQFHISRISDEILGTSQCDCLQSLRTSSSCTCNYSDGPRIALPPFLEIMDYHPLHSLNPQSSPHCKNRHSMGDLTLIVDPLHSHESCHLDILLSFP